MRLVASILLCAIALSAGAAEIWRWKDANGVVHYSDQPRAGAERVNIGPSISAVEPAPEVAMETRPDPESELSNEAPATPARAEGYTSCIVEAPAHDEYFQGVQAVTVSLSIQPELRPGHRVQLFVNGALRPDWPATATNYTLPEVFRGSHTLSVRIIDARGRPLCSGPSITFHVQQQSVIRPARPPAQSGA